VRIGSSGYKYQYNGDPRFYKNIFINNKAKFGGAAIRINGFSINNTVNSSEK
jgi:hypothetical protein